MTQLSDAQKERVQKYGRKYLNLSSEKWEEDEKERNQKAEHFQELLSPENLTSISESMVSEIVRNLWATQFWQKKQYKVDQIVEYNGLEKLGTELRNLLYDDRPVRNRFDRFQNNVKHLGPSSITEIMCLVSPDKFCIWNDKPKNILPFLNMQLLLPDRVYKYAITGEDYEQCIEVLDLVRQELSKVGLENPNFLDVDYFLYYIFDEHYQGISPEEETKIEQEEIPPTETQWQPEDMTHWDAIGLIAEIGNLLGYDTFVADPSRNFRDKTLGDIATLKEVPPFTRLEHLDTIKNIDAIWFEDEFPKCCFEVEHTTSITKGLLRIYQARNFNVTPFIIAPAENKSKFEREVNKEPFRKIKKEYQFRTYSQLAAFYEQAKKYHELRTKFLK